MKFIWQWINRLGSTQATDLLESPYRTGTVKTALWLKYLLHFNVLETEMSVSVADDHTYLCESKANITLRAHTAVFSDSSRMHCRLYERVGVTIPKPGERSLVFLEQ